jgi:murein DD-endopeptidase MepM/ murein hydrolase activator NlpD
MPDRRNGQAGGSRTVHHPASPPPPVAARQRGLSQTGYTLAYLGRPIRIGPVTFWAAVITLVIMAGWSVATVTYFAFKDDVLRRLIARHHEQQSIYEDRIAELRIHVDRLASRQLLSQDQFEHKLDTIMRRQTILESRSATMAGLPDMAPTGSVGRLRTAPLATNPANDRPKPSPTVGSAQSGAAAAEREINDTPDAIAAGRRSDLGRSPAQVEATLAKLQLSLDRVDARQSASLVALEERYESRAKRIRGVLTDLGLNDKKVAPAAVGGPYVPVRVSGDPGGFERRVQRIQLIRSDAERLTRVVAAVPVRQPIAGEPDLSSGFGVRADPFLGKPAMHSGLDFRSEAGSPVRATANGTVESAGWSGNYGKLIEIDHGNGMSTRYGHLSEIEVKAGQQIRTGQIIGRVGSTGRSTGPHLHYETRIDGDAVDPQKFLRAGTRLGNAL